MSIHGSDGTDVFETARRLEFSASTAAGISLNHAGISPSPARVVRAIQETAAAMGRDPMACFMQTLLPGMTSARTRLARLMGVPPEHLAFTKNTGHGLALIADGLALEPGDNVVVAAYEYPAVVYPWYAQKWRGVETRLVDLRPDGTLRPEDFAAKMDDRSRVVALSWVQFGNGFRADLAEFAEMAHNHGAILVADVIQALGASPCMIEAWNVDVAATGAHKWLMAPPGTGGLYIAPHVLENMHLVNMGAGSVVNAGRFDSTEFTPKPTAQRYEEGSPNALGLIGLEAALSLIEDVGIERIGERVLALAAHAARLVEAKGYRITTPSEDGVPRSGLVTFRHSSLPNEVVLEALTKAGIAAAVRAGNVRFSPHFYNNEADITAAVAALPE
jgi:selenocysteine lyase/cysteine desulfurase